MMATISPAHRSLIDQLTAHATAWAARDDTASNLLTLLIGDDDFEFLHKFVDADAPLVRSLLVAGIYEVVEKAERAEDPDDAVYLNSDDRAAIERVIGRLAEARSDDFHRDQVREVIDAAIATFARLLNI